MTKNNNGIIYAALIVIVLMGAVIAVQHMEIMKDNVTVELISYSGDKTVDVAVYQQRYGDWIGMGTTSDDAKIKKFNVTEYGIILYRDQSSHQTRERP
jgi:hypothetical protein